ncbi:MAG: sulfotransferase family 2 domain-containing protein [Elainella sp. Prado103]|nr:sulfotransferase family 2 domain-containing protein [Elainella sp. Prado103]
MRQETLQVELETGINDPRALIETANLFKQQQDFQASSLFYRKAIELQPNQPAKVYLDLAYSLHHLKQYSDVIAVCQQAIDRFTQNANLHYRLAAAQHKQQDFQPALANYRKAIELHSSPPHWFYSSLATILTQLGQTSEAILAYQATIAIKPDCPAGIYLNLGRLLEVQGQSEAAITTYQTVLRSSQNRYTTADAYQGLMRIYAQKTQEAQQQSLIQRYLINRKHKIIFCPIPKNACTLFKLMIVEHSDSQKHFQESGENIHSYVARENTGFGLDQLEYLQDQAFFKFVILRNPFERLVSAYLDKFVKPLELESFAQTVVQDVCQRSDQPLDFHRSITFSQFVDYLTHTENVWMNEHWRPQYTFFDNNLINFDLIGQFEQLEQTLKILEAKFNIQITRDPSQYHNKPEYQTFYQHFDHSLECHEMYPSQLRQFNGLPSAANLYTPRLKEQVSQRYEKDIALYQYHFGSLQ